ncbi:MAG TPA: histidine phosphatase family protein [Candidatus Limosilactobacillus faecipullorum]|nr:histidine phosphatase family protein [Candidatus Limosilactobacillus faecipullorum]
MTELLIVRHGQTSLNVKGVKQGTINTPATYLSPVGKQQAQTLAEKLDLSQTKQIFVSPLTRAQETAAMLNQTAQLPIEIDDRLKEISYGDWDGQLNQELEAQYPDHFYKRIHDVRPSYAQVAHGESFTAVQARVADFTTAVVKKYPDDQLLIVTHGFTVRSFAANAVGCQELEILEPANCSVTKIVIDPQTFEQHLVYYSRLAVPEF